MSQTTSESPEYRDGHLSAIVDQKMLVWGGKIHGNDTYFSHDEIWSLNLADKSWSKRIAMFKWPEDVRHPSEGSRIALVGNRQIYQFGGLHWPSGKYYNDLHMLDGITLEWEKIISKGPIPDETSDCGMCVLGEKIVMIRGLLGLRDDDVWLFSLTERFWTPLNCKGKQPSQRWGHTFTAIDENRAVLFGGFPCDDSFILNLAEKEWARMVFSVETPHTTPCLNHSALCVNIPGKGPHLFALWGMNSSYQLLSSAVIVDIEAKTCLHISLPTVSPTSDQTVCSVFVQRKIVHFIRFGGWNEKEARPLDSLTKLKWDPDFPERMVEIDEPSLEEKSLEAAVESICKFERDDLDFDEDEDFINKGGYGEVYKAKIKSSGQTVALKIIFRGRRLRTESDLLNKEARILFGIKLHPNIISVFGICDSPHCYGLLTEFMNGGDLAQLLNSSNPEIEKWDNRVDICQQIAMGMAHLHGNQPCVIHLDLKSSNVLIDSMAGKTGKYFICKICDFGLAKMSEVSSLTEPRDDGYTPAGTVAYIAPERYHAYGPGTKEERIETAKKSDVFSFGILLWEVRERAFPFKGMVKDAVSLHIKKGGSLPTGNASAPDSYNELLSSCCVLKPAERPSFNDVIKLLKSILLTENSKNVH